VNKHLQNSLKLLSEMGKSFKRNNSDSYKYGSNKKPKKPNHTRRFSNFESKLEEEREEWREAFKDLNKTENSDNDRRDTK